MSTRSRTILIVLVGIFLLLIGIGAAVLLIQRMNSQTQVQAEQAQVAKTSIVVMARDMKLGDRISTADVSMVEVPVEVVPRDAVTSLEAAQGKFLKSDMVQGEMVLAHNLADPTNNNHDLSYVLADDHVLLAFPATDLMSQENIIQRGDVIDIFATFQEKVKNHRYHRSDRHRDTRTCDAHVYGGYLPKSLHHRHGTGRCNHRSGIGWRGQSAGYDNTTAASRTNTTISSYLLALAPQDALVLKHLKDMSAGFDFVIRAPTSTVQFDLTPVTEEYIVELYGLEILP